MTNLLLLSSSFQKKGKRVETTELQQPLCVGRVAKPESLQGKALIKTTQVNI